MSQNRCMPTPERLRKRLGSTASKSRLLHFLPALTFAIALTALLISPLSLSPETRDFSLSLDLDSSEGNQAVQSLAVLPPSGNRVISIQIFGTDIQNAVGLSARFGYDVTQVVYEGFDAGDVLPDPFVIPEDGTNPAFVEINIASWSGGSATVNSGLIGTLHFRTTDAFSGITSIRLVRAELGRGEQFEIMTLAGNVALQVSTALYSLDFDGSGVVDSDDFLLFRSHFGTSRNDEAYRDWFDLDGNGIIGISDFLILIDNFGKTVPVAVGTIDPVTVGNDPVTVDVSGYFSDADSDVLHYTAVSSADGIAMASIAGSEVVISPGLSVGHAIITVTATNAAGLSAMQDIAVTRRLALAFADSKTNRALDENTLPGEKIGDPISVTGLDFLTYRLSGADADHFDIVSESGQLQTKAGMMYDYESKKIYSVMVVAMDPRSALDSIAVIITVNDVNEPPFIVPHNFLVVPGDRSLTVHYNVVGNEPGKPPVRGYRAELRTGEDGKWGNRQTIYGQTNTTAVYTELDNVPRYHDPYLINGQLYQIRVCTYNAEGDSDWSAPISGTPVYVPPVIRHRTEPEQFQRVDDYARTEIDLLDILGEGAKIIVPQGALPVSISSDEVEGVFAEIVKIEVSNAPVGRYRAGFTIPESSSIFDINLKAQLTGGETMYIAGALSEPVEICLPVPAGIFNPVIVHYNDDRNEWEVLDRQRVDGNAVCAIAHRFSIFGVAERVREATAVPVNPSSGGICGRTSQVQSAILSKIEGVTNCALVTDTHLAGITDILDIRSKTITALKANDFSGLSNLKVLYLSSNRLSTLPATVFSDLSSLRDLRIVNNRLSTLPANVFSKLSNLRFLYLSSNRLSRLPATVFSKLSNLRDLRLNDNRINALPSTMFSKLSNLRALRLHDNQLSTLPASVFSDLSSLRDLRLVNNRLSTLPANVFSGLSSGLTTLTLDDNSGAPFTLTLQLKRTDNTDVTASGPATIVVKVAEGAPFDMAVGLSVMNGTLSGNTATISAGSTQSGDITVTQSGSQKVTVSLTGTAPAPPTKYEGVNTALGNSLVLFTEEMVMNRAPEAVGTIPARTLTATGNVKTTEIVTLDVSIYFSRS